MIVRPQMQTNPKLSVWSSPAIEDSGWCSTNFVLGVGMVLIQRPTNKIVVIYESSKGYWFLPRGRKDIGETLEAAALREAYEEVS
jgi:8-oxo-dGTP pyrophosphatase MutT (NUDIX family)